MTMRGVFKGQQLFHMLYFDFMGFDRQYSIHISSINRMTRILLHGIKPNYAYT